MFDNLADARSYAYKMSQKYHETFYIVTWSRARFMFEVIGARDMYYSEIKYAEAVN